MKKLVALFAIMMATIQLTRANKLVNPYTKQAVVADTLKKDGIDPICKMKVKAGTTKTVVFDKVTYGFCSESCKKTFSQSPAKYVKKKKES